MPKLLSRLSRNMFNFMLLRRCLAGAGSGRTCSREVCWRGLAKILDFAVCLFGLQNLLGCGCYMREATAIGASGDGNGEPAEVAALDFFLLLLLLVDFRVSEELLSARPCKALVPKFGSHWISAEEMKTIYDYPQFEADESGGSSPQQFLHMHVLDQGVCICLQYEIRVRGRRKLRFDAGGY